MELGLEGEQTQLSPLINDILIAMVLHPLGQFCPRTDYLYGSVPNQLTPFIHSAPRSKGGKFETQRYSCSRVIGLVKFGKSNIALTKMRSYTKTTGLVRGI